MNVYFCFLLKFNLNFFQILHLIKYIEKLLGDTFNKKNINESASETKKQNIKFLNFLYIMLFTTSFYYI